MGLLKTTLTIIGVIAGSYVGASSAMASGLTRTSRLKPEDTPESVGLFYQDVTFTSRGGESKLSGWIIPPKPHSNSKKAQIKDNPWIVMVQGNNASRSDRKTGMLDIALALVKHGFGVLMFDMRARGDSPSPKASAGYYERLDLQGASDYLVSKGSDRNRIGVLGFALGGAVALMAGSKPGNFGAVVSDSSFADYSLMLKSSMSGFKRPLILCFPGITFMAKAMYGIDISEISPARSIAQSDTPVLIIHGEDDLLISVDHARRLGRAIGASFDEIENGKETVWIVPDAGHMEAFRAQPETYVQNVIKFFDAHLTNKAVTNEQLKPPTH